MHIKMAKIVVRCACQDSPRSPRPKTPCIDVHVIDIANERLETNQRYLGEFINSITCLNKAQVVQTVSSPLKRKA